MKIALLGAGGFIGSNLVQHLLVATDHEVIGLDREYDKLAELSGLDSPRFRFHYSDIREEIDTLDAVVAEADVVVDLVAYANPSIYVEKPLDVIEVNFLGNLDIVEACLRHGKRLIQYSSAEVYGKFEEPEGLVREDSDRLVYGAVDKHRWIYACAKQLLERIIHANGLSEGLEYSIIRPFNFVGPRIDYLVTPGSTGGPRVFPHFMSALLGDGPLQLVDGGLQNRAFCHIDDATAAFMTILEQPEAARNEIYNVGNPANDTTIRDLALLMRSLYEELTGRESKSTIQVISGTEFYGEGYEDGYRHAPSVAKLQQLGWTPRHDLRATLRSAMAYYLGERTQAMAAS
jgi:UDP-apiose/xylose synthase